MGPWILERLADPSRRASVVDYFNIISKLPNNELETLRLEAAKLPGLVGAILDIADPDLRRQLLSSPFMRKVLPNSKTVFVIHQSALTPTLPPH